MKHFTIVPTKNLIPEDASLTPISIESRANKTFLDQFNTGYIKRRKMAL